MGKTTNALEEIYRAGLQRAGLYAPQLAALEAYHQQGSAMS